jgi:hypothetical protein
MLTIGNIEETTVPEEDVSEPAHSLVIMQAALFLDALQVTTRRA